MSLYLPFSVWGRNNYSGSYDYGVYCNTFLEIEDHLQKFALTDHSNYRFQIGGVVVKSVGMDYPQFTIEVWKPGLFRTEPKLCKEIRYDSFNVNLGWSEPRAVIKLRGQNGTLQISEV